MLPQRSPVGLKRCRLKSFALSRLPHQNSRPPWPRGFRPTQQFGQFDREMRYALCRGFAHLTFTRHCASSRKPTPACSGSMLPSFATARSGERRALSPLPFEGILGGHELWRSRSACAGECCRLPAAAFRAAAVSAERVTISQRNIAISRRPSKDCVSRPFQKIEATGS